MKKALCAVLALVLSFCISFSASAASGINSAEKQVIDAIANGVDNYTALSKFQNVAKNYFNRDSVDVSLSEAEIICRYLDDACKVAAKTNDKKQVLNIHELPRADKLKVFQDCVIACSVLDLTLSYEQSKDRVIITDASGEVIFESLALVDVFSGKRTNGSQIKKTGTDYTAFYVTSAVLVAGLAVTAILINKRKTRDV